MTYNAMAKIRKMAMSILLLRDSAEAKRNGK
jgi:hypothetical protein